MDIRYFDGLYTILEGGKKASGADFAFQVHSNSNTIALVGGDEALLWRDGDENERCNRSSWHRDYMFIAMDNFYASWYYDKSGRCCNVLIQSNKDAPIMYDKEGEGKFQAHKHNGMIDAESFFSFPDGGLNEKQ